MAVLALGISYRRAPIELLERLAFGEDDLAKAFRRADDLEAVGELAILSTCNRVELYASVPSYHSGFLALKRLLCESRDVEADSLAEPLYSHFDEHAAEHLFAVAGGLDSMVVGEQQILSQVRDAIKRARAEGSAGAELTALFHSAARAGRRIRTETALGAVPEAFVEAAMRLVEPILGGLEGRRVALVGAGQMASLTMSHLRRRHAGAVRILNRSPERARRLAERTGSEHAGLDGLSSAIAWADAVVSATGAAGIVVSREDVRAALDGRDGRPLVLLDLAVPHDVDPAIGGLPGVTVVDVATLKRALQGSAAEAPAEIDRANLIVEEELRRYVVRRRSDRLAPLIRALRARGDAIIAAELERFGPRLASLTPDERDAVEGVMRGIVSKLLHDPIVQLKERSGSGADDAYARTVAELFDVDPDRE